jgi:hypothetical protein
MFEEYLQDKKIRYAALVFLIFLASFLLKDVIVKKGPISSPEIIFIPSKIDINFDLLKSSTLEEFLPFEKLSLPETTGRENPFIPYSGE